MNVAQLMTRSPACCTVNTPLPEVARMMVDHDCGEIPVLDDAGKPIGVITDRDICVRTVALGRNPLQLVASECMSSPCVTVSSDDPIEHCCSVIERYRIRRVPVIDANERCCGIVAQADLSRALSAADTGRVVQVVSQSEEGAWAAPDATLR